MLEPSKQQQAELAAIPGSIALVQFLVIKDQGLFESFRYASERTVLELGGERTHCVRIDQFLAGGAMPYQVIIVDQFPNSVAAQRTLN